MDHCNFDTSPLKDVIGQCSNLLINFRNNTHGESQVQTIKETILWIKSRFNREGGNSDLNLNEDQYNLLDEKFCDHLLYALPILFENEILLEVVNILTAFDANLVDKYFDVKKVITIIKTEPTFRNIELSCKILSLYAKESSKLCDKITRAQGIPIILSVYRDHIKNDSRMFFHISKVLTNMTYRSSINKIQVMKEGGLQLLLEELNNNKNSLNWKYIALKAIRNIINHDDTRAEAFVYNVPASILTTMTSYPMDVQIQTHCIWILLNMVHQSEENQRLLVERRHLKTIEIIIKTINQHRSILSLQRDCFNLLYQLSKITLNRIIIIQEGITTAISSLCYMSVHYHTYSMLTSGDPKIVLLRLLRNLMTDEFTVEKEFLFLLKSTLDKLCNDYPSYTLINRLARRCLITYHEQLPKSQSMNKKLHLQKNFKRKKYEQDHVLINTTYDTESQKAILKWIRDLTGKLYNIHQLNSGHVLCSLINQISPGKITKINHSDTDVAKKENTEYFLEACKSLDVNIQEWPSMTNIEDMDWNILLKCIILIALKTTNTWNGPQLHLPSNSAFYTEMNIRMTTF